MTTVHRAPRRRDPLPPRPEAHAPAHPRRAGHPADPTLAATRRGVASSWAAAVKRIHRGAGARNASDARLRRCAAAQRRARVNAQARVSAAAHPRAWAPVQLRISEAMA